MASMCHVERPKKLVFAKATGWNVCISLTLTASRYDGIQVINHILSFLFCLKSAAFEP